MNIQATHYCWVIGNTGFRESALYEKIESYIMILEKFNSLGYTWDKHQKQFFDLMQEKGFMENASTDLMNIKKAARLKTSPIEDLGLVDKRRIITKMGEHILKRAKVRLSNPKAVFDKEFFLQNDGDIYIKQLLKLQFSANIDQGIKPFILFLEYIKEFEYLYYDEIAYILPLIICEEFKEYGKDLIRQYRKLINSGQLTQQTKEQWIKNHISRHKYCIWNISELKNYICNNIDTIEKALQDLDESNIMNFLIKIDDNGKSEGYSKKLYPMFVSLYKLWENINNYSDCKKYIDELILGIESTTSTQQIEWRKHILGVTNKAVFKGMNDTKYKQLISNFKNNLYHEDFKQFVINFFDGLWYIKIINNLNDYADHNIRYLKLSNVLESSYINGEMTIKINDFYKVFVEKILADNTIKVFYKNDSDYKQFLYNDTYTLPKLSEDDMKIIAVNVIDKIKDLSNEFIVEEKPVYQNYREWIESLKNKYVELKVIKLIESNREMIRQNSDKSIISCLGYVDEYVKNRKNKKLQQVINTEADVPTMFEYLVWQSFLLLGHYEKNPVDFANFSLDNDLKPVQHAGGGTADVIFKYSDHDLILEATLTNDENQRKLEMEPVPRHLARYKSDVNTNAYCIFIAPIIDPNVAVVHRSFKFNPYYVKDKNNGNIYTPINNMIIIPIATEELRTLLKYSVTKDVLYKQLKDEIFDVIANSEKTDGYEWYSQDIVTRFQEIRTMI